MKRHHNCVMLYENVNLPEKYTIIKKEPVGALFFISVIDFKFTKQLLLKQKFLYTLYNR